MATLKLYFCKLYDSGSTEITVHRDLSTLLSEWGECDQKSTVGLIHISFIRPKIVKTSKLMIWKGRVLTTPSPKWALPSKYKTSNSVVGEVEISNEVIPTHLLIKGFGYECDEPSSVVSSNSMNTLNKITIADAALKILNNADHPLNKEEIYARIVENGLYHFGAGKPVSVLAVELNRYQVETEYSKSAVNPLFGKGNDGRFFSLTATPKKMSGWLYNLSDTQPELSAQLLPYGIYDEVSYLKNAHSLSSLARPQVDLFRFKALLPKINNHDLGMLLPILPECILSANISTLGFSVRIFNVLNKQNINSLNELEGVSAVEMMAWTNFGRKSAKDLCICLLDNVDKLVVSHMEADISIGVDLNTDITVEGRDQQFLVASSKNLKAHFETALSNLKDRDRKIIEYRTGYNCQSLTLEAIGKKMDVTRERIRQIQKKYVTRIIETEYWDDCIAIKIGQLLLDRKSPLYLEMMELEDKWFEGFMGNYNNLSSIIELFSENEIRIINIDGANVVSRITQDDWNACIRDFRIGLKDKAQDGTWTRKDVHMTFKSTLVDKGAAELLPLLWTEFSDSLIFNGDTDASKLVGFGKSAESSVLAVLERAEKPLHYTEIAERASELFGRDVAERLAHNAVMRLGGKLFGRGIYGLERLNPIPQKICEDISLIVTRMIENGALMKQWHCKEILSSLVKQFPTLPKELDQYLLCIILDRSESLVYLNRMVWARKDSGQVPTDRVDMADAFTKILEESDGPLKGSEIKSRLAAIRGVPEDLQIQPSDRLIQVGKDFWGLFERDVGGTPERNAEILNQLYAFLFSKERAIHVSEVEQFYVLNDISGNVPIPHTLLSLAQRDDRFYLAKAMLLGLAEWGGDVRRLNLTQAVRKVLDEMVVPMNLSEISAVVEGYTGLEIEGAISGLLISEGGVYDPTGKTWYK